MAPLIGMGAAGASSPAEVESRLHDSRRAVSVVPQGFRHAATLLLTNGVRAIPADASFEVIHAALERLAHALVALAEDTRAPVEVSDWLVTEFANTIDRLPHAFDRSAAKSAGATILARVSSLPRPIDARDLFLIYVPEDRLPVAAPLAIELTKRRVSVAFAEYEVAAPPQFVTALAHGLANHRGGIVLWTSAFERAHLQISQPEHDRVRILRQYELFATIADLVEWVHALRVSKP
jgi:hypothetical protein